MSVEVVPEVATHPVLDVRDVVKTYGFGETAVHALRGVSLTVERGDYVAVMGASGSGKSTLMNILGCLDIPSSGRYLLDGVDVSRLTDRQLALVRNRRIGFVFQSFNLIPRTTALANVELPLAYAGLKAGERRRRARAALAMVGLADRAHHEPNKLSGGQQQRVAVARALVTAPALVWADEPTGNLDTQSTADVLSVLDRLNRTGRTIVLITHEPDVAEHARRLIRLVDGRIVQDVRQAPLPQPRHLAGNDGVLVNLYETVRFAVRGVAANKLRSGLTVLGMLIGVAAVILLVAVGNGSAKQVQDRISQLGSSTLTISSGGRLSGTTTQNFALTTALVPALQDKTVAPHVTSVSPVVTSSQDTAYEGTSHTVGQFIGTYPSYLQAENYTIAQGTSFTQQDNTDGRKVVLIGSTTADDLFGGVNPLDQQITVNGTLFTVIGVLGNKDGTGFTDPNDVAIAPLTAVQQTLTGYGPLQQIIVQATSSGDVDAAQNEVTAILNTKLKVTNTANEPFRVLNAAQLLSTQASTAKTFTVLLGTVAGISLLVGGIGITNIMMVTVTERTREIGIRKALGAPRRTVLAQFLVEATVLSVIGGLLGVIAALIGSQFTIVGVKPVVVPASIVLAVGVSVVIGLFFGSYPASRAARLRPIEALRYE